ncbi:hypothetical protein RRG08_016348 [Elysia crispata]|uniref:Uncharacterized protein n=1 Tax=Elysia crispata TaxID=231223 RepID=A0AAE0Z002_9GAST|nr:hypothetical protein RRG08_016348 [Elysia crispata]
MAHKGSLRPKRNQDRSPHISISGEIITDRGMQTERWTEHYLELYFRETIVNNSLLIIDELRKVIKSLVGGKAPGSDGLAPKIIKLGSDNSLLSHLHKLLLQCWKEGTMPPGHAGYPKIVTIYKNKGECSYCNNSSASSEELLLASRSANCRG